MSFLDDTEGTDTIRQTDKKGKNKRTRKEKKKKHKSRKISRENDNDENNKTSEEGISDGHSTLLAQINSEDVEEEDSDDDREDGAKYLMDNHEADIEERVLETEDIEKDDEEDDEEDSVDEMEDDDDEEEEGKKKKEKPSTFTVSGFVYGVNKNTLENCCNFKVQEIIIKGPKRIPKIFPIIKIRALPSYCPWIMYKVVVRPPETGSIYTIVEVLQCSFRAVDKAELKKFLVFQYSATSNDVQAFKKRVSKAFRKVTNVIHGPEALDVIHDKYINMVARNVTKPRFGGVVLLSLLPYFSYTFLASFNERQLVGLLCIVMYNPYMFCFWDMFVSTALCFKDGNVSVFTNREGELDIDNGYINRTMDKITQTSVVVVYDPNYPNWSVATYQKVIRDFKRWDINSIDFETVTLALLIYLKYQEKKLYSKNSTMTIDSIKDSLSNFTNLESRIESAVDYLTKQKILVSTKTLYSLFLSPTCQNQLALMPTSDRVLTEPIIGVLEFDFLHLLNYKKIRLQLYSSGEYTSEYIYGFKNFAQTEGLSDAKFTHTIWLSSNSICARYMRNETGFQFEAIGQYVTKQKYYIQQQSLKKKGSTGNINAKIKSIRYVVIDRIHKCGLLEVKELVRLLASNVTIYMFGDLEEYGPNHKKDTHHLLYELQGFNVQTLPNSYTITNITRIRDDIQHNRLNSKYVENLHKPKDLTELIKNIENLGNDKKKKKKSSVTSKADEENNNRSYQLLCSNQDDANIINIILSKRTGGDYKRGEYALWDKVHIQEDGMIGRLENVWRVDAQGNRKSIITNLKEKINLFRGYYQFTLYQDTRVYSTNKCTLDHADIIPLSKFAGAPSDYIIFVVGKKTSFNDINIATKYARKDFKLMLLQDTNIGQILSKRIDIFWYRFNNDLGNKVSFFKAGLE